MPTLSGQHIASIMGSECIAAWCNSVPTATSFWPVHLQTLPHTLYMYPPAGLLKVSMDLGPGQISEPGPLDLRRILDYMHMALFRVRDGPISARVRPVQAEPLGEERKCSLERKCSSIFTLIYSSFVVKSPYRPTSDSYGDRCGMLVFSCIKHEGITSLWALLEKPFDNLHFLQNIQSLWEYLWGTILMTRSGTFVYMRYASAVGLLPWECEMGSSRTAFSIVTSRRSARTIG